MQESNKNVWVGIAVVLLILALATFGAMKYTKRDATVETPVVPNNSTSTPVTTPGRDENDYKDGTYSASGTYFSPGGSESIDLTVTIKDDVIVDSVFKGNASRPQSVTMQGVFGANYKVLIIGKNIDEVNLSKVSGSSLTSGGFNEALNKIKIEARG